MQLVQVVCKHRIRRTFLVNCQDAEEALNIIHNLNKEETAEGEPLFPIECALLAEPVEFERKVMEI